MTSTGIPPGPRLFVAGCCVRCHAGYVALSAGEANGACGRRCTRALQRRDPGTSAGRSRARRRQRYAAAHAGELCPVCHKVVHVEGWQIKQAVKKMQAKYGVPLYIYGCPAGYGLHTTSNGKNHRREAGERCGS